MFQLTKLFLLFSFFLVSQIVTAQVSKHVQFSFLSGRDNDGAFLSIKAKIADSTRLFSTKKKAADDVFVSAVEFDSAARKVLKDTLLELGQLKTALEPAN